MSRPEEQKLIYSGTPVGAGRLSGAPTISTPSGPDVGTSKHMDVSDGEGGQPISAEYRFVHQRIPLRLGNERFLLPIILILFEVIFIVLFAVFANYSSNETIRKNPDLVTRYPSNLKINKAFKFRK